MKPTQTMIAVAPAALLAFSGGLAADEFSELRPLIELNATDGDAGLQIFIDADRWQSVTVHNPDGELIYEVAGSGGVQQQGLTENFFESAEPDCQELPLPAVLERFPAGDYSFSGVTIDGEKFEDDAELTHALPAAPQNLSPDKIGGVDPVGVAIAWSAGADLGACPPDGADVPAPANVELFGYQVIVEQEEADGTPLQLFVDVPATTTRLPIPDELLQNDAIYKYEVVAIEARDDEKGNQTVVESFFCTAPITTEDCELPN